MEPNDLERAVLVGARLTRAAVGLGLSLALAPARLVLRAVSPAPPEPDPAAWRPPPQPSPPPPVVPLREEPPAPPVPARGVPSNNDLSAAEAARLREAEREAETDDDSPGPEIRVEEPWDGYADMNVGEVLERLVGADPTTRAMVRLYEESHKNRKGVLRATE